ncbi:hypothetical protein WICMUC_005547 [Wickerhamomyces mucosus]|uniref:AB hydrolase-1 domain-containing protein n=1 Tax=Wickerhamomyces mucosus TaxID=1378264 RepID=A0A9P8P821_9ASCO|nr:hypothetical protein WICMUC_005547 [Wickerhamomyces mucosus]
MKRISQLKSTDQSSSPQDPKDQINSAEPSTTVNSSHESRDNNNNNNNNNNHTKFSSFKTFNHKTHDDGLTPVEPNPIEESRDQREEEDRSDENTRLLQSSSSTNARDLESQTQPQDHYVRGVLLSPDDPIVSPLNLYQVQIQLKFLKIFNFINLIILILIIINDFIALGDFINFNNYNFDSYLEILVIGLIISWIIITLWLIEIVSKSGLILNLIFSISILTIELFYFIEDRYKFDRKFTYFQIFAKIWKILLLILINSIDYFTLQGKNHQEIKYTGRIESRRTLNEWFQLLIKFVLKIIILILLGLIILNQILFKYDETKAFKEYSIDSNDLYCIDSNCSSKLNVQCFGDLNSTSQPLIIYDSGYFESSKISSKWIDELFQLGKIDHYCIYDRPGYGLSTNLKSPVSFETISKGLKRALTNGNLELNKDLKFLLVGYNQGGLFSKIFASLIPDKIDSILLIDSWDQDIYTNNSLYINLIQDVPKLSRFQSIKLYLRGILAKFGFSQQYSWIFHRLNFISRLFNGLIKNSNYLKSKFQELLSFKILSLKDLQNSNELIKNVKISIISSNYLIKKNSNWGQLQKKLIKLSNNLYDWKIVELNKDESIYLNHQGKIELQNSLLRLIN